MSSDLPSSGTSAAAVPSDAIESPAAAIERPAIERSRAKELLVRIATERQLLLVVLIGALIAVMTILEPTTFTRGPNAAVVLLDTAQTGILACGMMVLMIPGMFDLSIGGILAFSGIIAGMAAKYAGLPPILAFLIGCGWGVLLGAVNGVLVTRFKINALIATLATLLDLPRRCSSWSPAPASPTSATATRCSARRRSSASTRRSGSWR